VSPSRRVVTCAAPGCDRMGVTVGSHGGRDILDGWRRIRIAGPGGRHVVEDVCSAFCALAVIDATYTRWGDQERPRKRREGNVYRAEIRK